MVWIALLDGVHFLEISLQRPVGDQLDIVQSHDPGAGIIDGAQPGGYIDYRLTQGFPDRASPAGVKGPHDLLAAVGGRPGTEPKGVGAFDAAHVDG